MCRWLRLVTFGSMKRGIFMLGLGLVNAMGWAQTNLPAAAASNPVVIAIVGGKEITSADKANLDGLIFGALLEKFAKENTIAPTEAELDAFTLQMEEKQKQHQLELEQDMHKLRLELESTSLSERGRKGKEELLKSTAQVLKSFQEIQERNKGPEEQLRPMWRHIATQWVSRWKINQALYKKYGGRVVFQQAGMEPVDAYRDFLKEQEQAGAFQIIDKQSAASFWRYFTTDSMHRFCSKEEGDAAMTTPWWLMEKKPEPPASPPVPPPTKSKADPQAFWFFECRGNELFYLDKDELDVLFKKMLTEEAATHRPPANPVGNASYVIDPESGIGMLRLHPRAGVPGDTLADIARATGHYQTLLKQLAHTRSIFFIDHGDSAEILDHAVPLAKAAGFEVSTQQFDKDDPIKFRQ